MPITEHLNKFREEYPHTKVDQGEDELTYFFHLFYNAVAASVEAKNLIKKLDLPLIVEHSSSNSFFVVKGKE